MKARTSLLFVAVLGLCAVCGPALAEWTEPIPVTEVNTDSAEEWSPFLSFDGLTLYFARVRSDTFYYGRIFEATREKPFGPFTSVREISGALNSSAGHVLLPWVSPDNLRMYYHNELHGTFTLKVSERTSVSDPWIEGASISELNMLGDWLQAPRLTADELTIFFNAYEIPGGQGGYDIWMATRPDRASPFGEVWNLQEINTTSGEWSPFVSPDGLTLYFASNRNGDTQLFRAIRGSLDAPFGNLEHLSSFDTPGRVSSQPCLASDGSTLYCVKQLGQDRSSRDIYVSYLIRQEVPVDIKPSSCPNPLNLASRGVLPVAILGTEDFDVNTVDVASIRLAGVAPIRSSFEDVTAPVWDGNQCECNTEGPDGYTDLTLKFRTQQVVEELINSLGEFAKGEELILTLTGTLSDGTPIEGEDCVVIVGKVPRPLAAKKLDINEDGIVNILDFGIMANYWLESAFVQY